MSGVLFKVQTMKDNLPESQTRLADYILQNPEMVPLMSIGDLAEAADTSSATVSRFAREVGYTDFREFKALLGRESRTPVSSIYQAIEPGDSDADVVEKVFAGNMRSLDETLGALDRKSVSRVAAMLRTSRRLLFFGIGSSGNIASDAALRFAQLGLQSEAYVDSYQMLCHATHCGSKDVVFGFSHTGRTEITVQAISLAREGGAHAVGVSNQMRSPLHEVSDSFFCTAFPESRLKVAALSSRVAQVCLVDAIYVLVAREMGKRMDVVERFNRIAEESLRSPGQ